MKEQFGSTRAAGVNLVRSHIDLLKVEVAGIVAQIKSIAILGGVIFVLALLAGNLLFVGTWLFLGEWLFGSLGWGLLHGVLFMAGLITALVLVLLYAPVKRILLALLVAIGIAAAIGALLGFNLLPDAVDTIRPQLAEGVRDVGPALIGAGVGLLLLGILGAILGRRAGATLPGLIGGAIVGAILGAVLVSVRFDARTATATAIALALLLWIVLQVALTKSSLDPQRRFGHLYPKETLETALETKTWLGQQWQERRKKLARQ